MKYCVSKGFQIHEVEVIGQENFGRRKRADSQNNLIL